MATKNVALHHADAADFMDAAEYLAAYGTLQGWRGGGQGTYQTGEQLTDYWMKNGVDRNGDGTLDAGELKSQIDATNAAYGKGVQTAKYGKGTDLIQKALPYIALAAQAFPGVGTALSGALGPKLAGLMTGAAKFSNSGGIDLLTKAALSKLSPELGKSFAIAGAGQMLKTPGAKAMSQTPGMYGYKTPVAPQQQAASPTRQAGSTGSKYSLSNLNQPQGEKYSLDGLDDPNAGNQWGLSGSLPELGPMGGGNAALQEILKLQQYGFNPGAPGHGGQPQSTRPPAIPGIGGVGGVQQPQQPAPQVGGGGQGGGGQDALSLAAIGLLTNMFKKDNKPAAAAPAAQPRPGVSYSSLVGLPTNADAIDDQARRLLFAQRMKGVA